MTENKVGEKQMTEENMTEEKVTDGSGSKLMFVLFYALGTLTLVPSSFYITANDYWLYKFRNVSLDNSNATLDNTTKTDLQASFMSTNSAVSNSCSAVAIVLTIALHKISPQKKICCSLFLMVLLMTITLVFVWINTDAWQKTFFVVSQVIAGLLSGSGLCFTVTVFQFAVRFPRKYLGSLLSGQSVCGITVSLIQIFTLAMGSSSKITAFIYFAIGDTFIFAVLVLFSQVLVKDKYFQASLASDEGKDEKGKNKQDPLDKSQLKRILIALIPMLLTILLTSGSAGIVHPGISSLIESVGKGSGRWNDVFFIPVCTFLAYNVFDFCGRESSLRWNVLGSKYVMLVASVLRLILIPMIMFCNIQPRHHLPVVFDEDYAYVIILVVFAFTGGYLTNLCVLQLKSAGRDMKIAMFITMIVMILGIAGFSFLSGVLRSML